MSEEFLATLGPLTERINATLKSVLSESGDFLAQVGLYGLSGGGKRLRPLMFCLACAALGREADEETLRQSATYELTHLASLYHDDIVDQSETRRGRPAAHMAFGIPEVVLVADYLMAKAAEISLTTENIDCIKVFVRVLKEMSLGELAQLKNRNNADLSAEEYEETIYRKTAVLMEGVTLTAGLWLKAQDGLVKALGEFGRLLGLAFQIIDDVLDYEGQPGKLGKPIGQDLDEGRATLPFILAREKLAGADRDRLLALGSQGSLSPAEKKEIISLVRRGQGLKAARAKAAALARAADEALLALPPSPARDDLSRLSGSLVERDK
jgi:octaprenyl-diphosphate synthase